MKLPENWRHNFRDGSVFGNFLLCVALSAGDPLVVIAAIAAGFNAREFNVAGFHAAHFNASGVSILDPRGNRPFAADTDHSHNQYIRAIRVHAAIDEVAGDAGAKTPR
ncbi:hypothetical protein [Specibacter sp. NPDC078692]|uniref:hypothetical protein n=1 Tax=Specibacter sp. NPDC078692 TaxID=3155818 RepID=UPI0034373082